MDQLSSTSTIITRDGSRTRLITTSGFEDTLVITRGAYGRWSGQSEDVIKHPILTTRPEPLVPRSRIAGVFERIDRDGNVVLDLDEKSVETAVRQLVDGQGVEAIAVCLLWSFRNPSHEGRVREITQRLAPGVHVSISCEIAPVAGEYERSSTTVINAYAGRVTKNYLDDLSKLLTEQRLPGIIGRLCRATAARFTSTKPSLKPVGMIECGPAAGVISAQFMGRALDAPNVIAADMGGTTFKVSVIQNGDFEYAREPIVDRLHYVAK